MRSPASDRKPITLVLALVSGSVGYAAASGSGGPLVLAAATLVVAVSTVAAVETRVGRLAVAICFDADHSDTWAHLSKLEVDVVAIPASDWPAIGSLHTDMARLRSQSIGAAMVRPARSGVSVITDSHGQLLSSADHRRRNDGAVTGRLAKAHFGAAAVD